MTMRLDQPIDYQIRTIEHKKFRLKKGTCFHLEIGPPKSDDSWNYWEQPAMVRVEIIRTRSGHSDDRLTVELPGAFHARSAPATIFDTTTFVRELNCDVGLLFSALCAPLAELTIRPSMCRHGMVWIRLAISDRYASETEVPLSDLKRLLVRT